MPAEPADPRESRKALNYRRPANDRVILTRSTLANAIIGLSGELSCIACAAPTHRLACAETAVNRTRAERHMDRYDPDALYAAMAQELFLSRAKARVTGGTNNIRAKGDGPEQAVRHLIGSLTGGQYRVTQGHVVRADGLKSGQIDIIVVKDVPAATMHTADEGETELVRVEWVAAVGEVKASWAKHTDVVRSFRRLVDDIDTLQEGRLVRNKLRFGAIANDTPMADIARPVTGREWANRCYAFLIALDQGACKVPNLADDFKAATIRASDSAALILDQHLGATLCTPARAGPKGVELGVGSDVHLNADDAQRPMSWVTVQEEGHTPAISCGRLLHYFVAELQLHLGTWYDEYNNPKHYAKLGKMLRHRHPREAKRS